MGRRECGGKNHYVPNCIYKMHETGISETCRNRKYRQLFRKTNQIGEGIYILKTHNEVFIKTCKAAAFNI